MNFKKLRSASRDLNTRLRAAKVQKIELLSGNPNT